jgi:WD40 repeat protein
MELQRWLAGEPIHSRPSTSWEKTIKWAKRRPAAAALLTVSTAAALGLLILAGFLWRNAESRAEAVKNLATAEADLRTAKEEKSIVVKQVESKRAESAAFERKAQEAKESARHSNYVADMQLAQAAWETDNVARMLGLLEKYRLPRGEHDLRGFEWDYLWRLCHRDRLTLSLPTETNEPPVEFSYQPMALTHDGNRLASLGSDNKIHLWNLSLGRHERVISAPPGAFVSLSFARDDKDLILVRAKKHLALGGGAINPKKMQDFLTGKGQPALGPITESLEFLSLQVDHPLLLSIEKFDPARLVGCMKLHFPINSNKREPLGPTRTILFLKGRLFGATTMAVSPDHKLLALGGNVTALPSLAGTKGKQGAGILLWDLSSNQEKNMLVEQSGLVNHLAWAPDGKTLASSGFDKTIRLWDVDQGKERAMLKGHTSLVISLAYAANGNILATASIDGIIKVWDAKTSQLQITLKGHLKEVIAMAFSTDSKNLISLGKDGVVKIWDLVIKEGPIPAPIFEKTVKSLMFSVDCKTLSGLDLDGNLKTLDLTTSQELRNIAIPSQALIKANQKLPFIMPLVHCAAFSPDGKTIAFVEALGDSIWLYDAATAMAVNLFKVDNSLIQAVSFSSDNKTLGVGYRPKAQSGKVQGWKLWNISTGEELPSPKGIFESVQCIAFSWDGKRLATANEDTVTIRELATGNEILKIDCYSHVPASMTFSPDGKRLATGGSQQELGRGGSGIKLWDLATGQEILSLGDSRDIVAALAFSPNGKQLAAAIGVDFDTPLLQYPRHVNIWDTTPVNEPSN